MENSGVVLYVITGASKGIGRAIAARLAQHDISVRSPSVIVLTGRDESGLQTTKSQVESEWAKSQADNDLTNSLSVVCSVLDLNDVSKINLRFAEILSNLKEKSFSRAVLINNAGSALNCIVPDIYKSDLSTLSDYFNSNSTSTILITSQFISHFSSSTTAVRLVNMTSGAASSPFYGYSLYSSVKAGRDAFFKAIAVEASNYPNPNVKVLTYNPGVTNTDMFDKVGKSLPQDAWKATLEKTGVTSSLATAGIVVNLLLNENYKSGEFYSQYLNGRGALLGFCNPLLDISVNADQSLLDKYELKPANAILAEDKHLPLYDEISSYPKVEYIAGGAGQNTIRAAQWMSRVKGATVYVGCTGKGDKYGEEIKKQAIQDGVDVHYMETTEKPTGTCAVLIVNKDRSMVANLSAANLYKKEHLDANLNLLDSAEVVYITGFFITVSPDTIESVGQHCAKNNKPFSMNLSAPFVVQFFGDKLEGLLKYVDLLFGNETEAQALGERMKWGSNLEEVARLASALPKENGKRERLVIFTQGSDPVIVARGGKWVKKFDVPKVNKEEIVDTNGAGDCFVGGFLSEYLNGSGVGRCIDAANYCAGVCIRTSGIKFPSEPPKYNAD